MSRATDKALGAATAAEQDHARWTTALTEAERAVAAADTAQAESPEDLDRVGQEAVRATARLGAARRALAMAGDRLLAARRAVLYAEANDEADAAKTARKECESHSRKLTALLDQLERLDGVRYPLTSTHWDGRADSTRSVGARLRHAAETHETREAVLRATADTGRVPHIAYDLAEGRPKFLMPSETLTGEQVPTSAREYAALVAGPQPEPEPEPDSAPHAGTYSERKLWSPEEANADELDPLAFTEDDYVTIGKPEPASA